jgi:hypothetical protein
MARVKRFALILAVLAWALGRVALAQEQTTDFVPVQPGDQAEQIPAAQLVFAAYAFVWATFVVYLFVLWQRMKRVEVDLKDVSARLGGRRG